jgi:hypothetical protein
LTGDRIFTFFRIKKGTSFILQTFIRLSIEEIAWYIVFMGISEKPQIVAADQSDQSDVPVLGTGADLLVFNVNRHGGKGNVVGPVPEHQNSASERGLRYRIYRDSHIPRDVAERNKGVT